MIRPPILSVEKSREVDRLATEEFGIPSFLLMENAGRELAAQIVKAMAVFPRTTHLIFLCGHGNNAGDGFVAARHLQQHHPNIKIYLSHDPSRLKGDPLMNFNILNKLGFTHARYPDFTNDRRTVFSGAPLVFIDALVGTGLKGEVEGIYKDIIADVIHLKKYHNAKATVIAADIPSGLHGDEGPVW